jgi:cell division protein FtsL
MLRLFKSSLATYVLILAVSAAFLFIIKHKVHTLRKELSSIHSQIIQEKETIHVLKAEYTYLSSPKRVRSLSDKYLQLETVKPDQIINTDAVKQFIKPPKPADIVEGVE